MSNILSHIFNGRPVDICVFHLLVARVAGSVVINGSGQVRAMDGDMIERRRFEMAETLKYYLNNKYVESKSKQRRRDRANTLIALADH